MNPDSLHAAIMNIGCLPTLLSDDNRRAYQLGHRDARHAAAELVAASAAPQGAQPVQAARPVARLHIEATDTYLRATVEVLDGSSLQPEHSPVDVFLAAHAAPVVPQVRMLTADEAAPLLDEIIGNYPSDLAERIVRKAFEVNAGLTIPAPKDAS